MRYLVLIFSLLLPSPVLAYCQGTNLFENLPPQVIADLNAVRDATPYGTGLFWRAERGDTTLYIMGTMHLFDPRHEANMAQLTPYIDGADIVLIEATAEDQNVMERRIASDPDIAFITSGPTLIDRLTPEEWAEITAALQTRGIPAFFAAKFQPWYLSLTLGIPPCAMEDVIAKKKGLDAMVEARAAALDLPVAGLDDINKLIETLASGTLEEQIEQLKFALASGSLNADYTAELFDLYFAGETSLQWELLRHLALQYDGLDPETYDHFIADFETKLLADRNADWIPIILDRASDKSAFIAIGALHLPGETGVLTLLSHEGFAISPIALE